MIKKIFSIFLFCFISVVISAQTIDSLIYNIGDIVAWYAADSVHEVDMLIDTLYDKSGNNRHAIQKNKKNQAQYKKNDDEINNLPSIIFDGDDYFLVDFLQSYSQPNTYIVIAEFSTENSSQVCFTGLSGEERNQLQQNPTQMLLYAGTIFADVYTPTGKISLYDALFYGAKSRLTINNSYEMCGNAGGALTRGLSLGAYFSGQYGMKGKISELLFFNKKLNTEEYELLVEYLRTKYTGTIELGVDIDIKYGFKPVELSYEQVWGRRYRWSNGEKKSSISVNSTGEYILEVTDYLGFVSQDTIKVSFPMVNQPEKEIKICLGDEYIWEPNLSGEYSFLWSDGSTGTNLSMDKAGQYWLTITDKNGYEWRSDTVTVFVDSLKEMHLFEKMEYNLCMGEQISTVINGDYSYLWTTGSKETYLKVLEPGKYGLTVESNLGCGSLYEEVIILKKGEFPIPQVVSLNHCLGDDTELLSNSYSVDNRNIVSTTWIVEQDTLYGETQTHKFSMFGDIPLQLFVENEDGCMATIVDTVHIHPMPVASFSPLIACQYTEREITSTSKIADGEIITYSWEVDGKYSSEKSVQVLSDEVRMVPAKLTVTSDHGCVATKEDEIQVVTSTKISLIHKDVCVGDTVLFFDATEYPVYNAQQEAYWLIDHTQKRNYSPLLPYITTDTTTHIVELYAKTFNGCMNIGRDTLRPYAIPEPRMDTLYTCVGSEIILKNSGVSRDNIASYVWNIADSLTFTEEKPSFVLQRSGLFPVSLQVTTEAGCQASTTSAIVIDAQPQADFTFFPKKGAEPLFVNFTNESKHAVAYTWTFEQKEVETIEDPSYLFTDKETSYAKLVAHSVHDCRDSITKRIPLTLADEQLQITDVRTTIDANGFVSYAIQILNSGNVATSNIELLLSTPDIASLAESWNGTLEPGTVLDYVFAAKTKSINGTLPQYVCVTAEIVSPEEYKVYFSDNFCMDQTNEFSVYYVAPNPVGKEATVAFNTKRKGTITVSCIDENGKVRVKREWENIEAGFHTIQIDTMELPSGRYVLIIEQDNQKQRIPFVK